MKKLKQHNTEGSILFSLGLYIYFITNKKKVFQLNSITWSKRFSTNFVFFKREGFKSNIAVIKSFLYTRILARDFSLVSG